MKEVSGSLEEALRGASLAVLEFGGEDCPACLQLKKVLNEIEGEFKDVSFLYADVENVNNMGMFTVMSLPTTFLLADGMVVDTIIGAVSKQTIREKIASLLYVR